MAYPTLNSNEVLTGLHNQIISQQVFADNFSWGNSLANKFRTDGTLYGDTKLFYATDVLRSYAFELANNAGVGGMAYNLLTEHLPKDPDEQAIVIDTFRQIPFTYDMKLAKRAWINEGAFGEYVSVMKQQIRNTKIVYDTSLVNAFVGTYLSQEGLQTQSVDFSVLQYSPAETTVDNEADYRLRALAIGKQIADIKVDLEDFMREYNDYGNMRSYDWSDFIVVWNKEYINLIQHVALPTVFNKDGVLVPTESVILNKRWFGYKLEVGSSLNNINATTRLLTELDYLVAGAVYHGFAGDPIQNVANMTDTEKEFLLGKVYNINDSMICKIVHKNAVKYMSAFEVATEWFNPQTLRSNAYLTWGHSSPTRIKNYPFITIVEA